MILSTMRERAACLFRLHADDGRRRWIAARPGARSFAHPALPRIVTRSQL